MPKYLVHNPGPNVAKELKPGIGEFTILPNKSIEIPDKILAESLVNDSGGHLKLIVIDDPKPTLTAKLGEVLKSSIGVKK